MLRSLRLLAAVACCALLSSYSMSIGDRSLIWNPTETPLEQPEAGDRQLLEQAGPLSLEMWGKQLSMELANDNEAPPYELQYGSRSFNETTGDYEIHWGTGPVNVVRVCIEQDDSQPDEPPSSVPVEFHGVFRSDGTLVHGEATAYINAPEMLALGGHTD